MIKFIKEMRETGSMAGGWLRFYSGSLVLPILARGLANVAYQLPGNHLISAQSRRGGCQGHCSQEAATAPPYYSGLYR